MRSTNALMYLSPQYDQLTSNMLTPANAIAEVDELSQLRNAGNENGENSFNTGAGFGLDDISFN